jgi:hypothetical protein
MKYPEDDFIDLSNSLDPEIIKLFFNIIIGKSIWINESNQEKITNTIGFLEFNSIFAFEFWTKCSINFTLNDISSLGSLPIDSIQKIISSHFLSLKNENQLFEFLKSLIQKNEECSSFLTYLHFGLISFPNFTDYLNLIQFYELSSFLFYHMKYSFHYNYLLSADDNTQQEDIQYILLFSESLGNYFQIYKTNQDSNIQFESFSEIFNIFEIPPSTNKT